MVRGSSALWLHPLDGGTPRPLQGTEGAVQPFWSPDSRSLGFFASLKLQRIDIAGGAPQPICDAPSNFRGGAWGTDGTILIGRFPGALSRVTAGGGIPRSLTSLDAARSEAGHVWPQALPNGKFLYLAYSDKAENDGVYEGSLAQPGERIRLLSSASPAVYSTAGYLLWARGAAVMAQRFDAAAVKLGGEPEVVADGIDSESPSGDLEVTVSGSGLLLYRANSGGTRTTWLNREGKSLGVVDKADDANVRLSPDGLRLAIMRRNSTRTDLWLQIEERDFDASDVYAGDARKAGLVPGRPLRHVHLRYGSESLPQGDQWLRR